MTVQRHPNGSTTYFAYDGAGRLSEKVTREDSDGSVLVKFAYTRDATGNPIAIERESALGVFYYEHDELNRLAYEGQFIAAAARFQNYYDYDASGNRAVLRHIESGADELVYYGYDDADEPVNAHSSAGWTCFGYDGAGSVVMEQTPTHTRYYDWDGRGRLTGVRSTEGGWTDTEYRYDGLGRRVMALDSGGFVYFDWDGLNVLRERDGSLATIECHVPGYAPRSGVGDVAQVERSGTAYVPVTDQVGTTWNVLSDTGVVATYYEYEAFGVGRHADEAFANPYRFAGKRLDADAGHCHFSARDYAPVLGRFTGRDIPTTAIRNPYTYALSNPLTYRDPTGLQAEPPGDGGLRWLWSSVRPLVRPIAGMMPWLLGTDEDEGGMGGPPASEIPGDTGDAIQANDDLLNSVRGAFLGDLLTPWPSTAPEVADGAPEERAAQPTVPDVVGLPTPEEWQATLERWDQAEADRHQWGPLDVMPGETWYSPDMIRMSDVEKNLPLPQPAADAGSNNYYGGYDFQLERHAYGGIGWAAVSCCDENDCEHWVLLEKKCKGPMVGAALSGHALGGIRGKQCPGGYVGWFTEYGLGPFSYFSGEHVSGAGGGFGFALGRTKCEYTILLDRKLPGKCSLATR